MEIKNVILDYGNVVFTIDFGRLDAAMEKAGIKHPENLVSHEHQRKMFDDFEAGLITENAFRAKFKELTTQNLSDHEVDEIWNSLLVGVPEGNNGLLRQLATKYRLFLLSNNNAIHLAWIKQYLQRTDPEFSFDNVFEKAYFSHEMKMRKPHREIFETVLAQNGLKGAETLFIDDTKKHLEGAAAAGVHTLYMDAGAENLGAFLKAHRLL